MAFGNNYSYNPYVNPYASPYNAPQAQFNQPMQFNAQPQQPPQNATQSVGSGFMWVNNIDEAQAYMVAPNSAVQLWDKNSPCVYLKSADSTGKPTMQIFDLVERKQEDINFVKADGNDVIEQMRDDIETLKSKVDALMAKKVKTKVKEDVDNG